MESFGAAPTRTRHERCIPCRVAGAKTARNSATVLSRYDVTLERDRAGTGLLHALGGRAARNREASLPDADPRRRDGPLPEGTVRHDLLHRAWPLPFGDRKATDHRHRPRPY